MRHLARSAVAALALSTVPVLAAPPQDGERAGRYLLQPIEGGYLRLDSETGAMSLCLKRGTGVACELVQDDRSAVAELDRLAAENRDLKAEVKRLGQLLASGDGLPGDKPAHRGPKLQIPSEEDVDKAINYLDRMIKKFRDKWKELDSGQGRGRGSPL